MSTSKSLRTLHKFKDEGRGSLLELAFPIGDHADFSVLFFTVYTIATTRVSSVGGGGGGGGAGKASLPPPPKILMQIVNTIINVRPLFVDC